MRSIAIWRPPFGQGWPVPPQALTLPPDSPALEWQGKPKPPRPRIALLKLLLLKLLLIKLLRVALASRALAAALGVAIRCCLMSSWSAQQK